MYQFIVNPHARSGLGHVVWSELESILNRDKITYKVYFTKFQKHATEITKEITSDGKEHTIIALGGDGTINEIINGISDFEKTILGYIPIGSSNDFARSLNLPNTPSEALNLILTASDTHSVNIGSLHYKNHYRHFAVSAGIGFDAAICHEAVISKLKILLNKLRIGKLTYAGIALHRLLLTPPQEITLSLDNQKELLFPSAYFVSIMNHKYEGGGLKLCPKALPDDGMLDVIVIAGISKLKILTLLPTAFVGWHTHFKGVYIYKCRHITIDTAQALPVHTDGEPIFLQHHISASCEKKMLRIITPVQ